MQDAKATSGFDSEGEQRFLNEILKLFVVPEVERRQEAGSLPVPFGLERFQVLMWASEGRQPRVLLNDEVRIIPDAQHQVTATHGNARATSPLELAQVKSRILVDEPDAAHVTFFRLGGLYYLVFDFTYNRSLAGRYLQRADEFIAGATSELDAGRRNAAVELLWSGMELVAITILLARPDHELMTTRVHAVRLKKFEEYGSLNLAGRQTSLLRRLTDLRAPARYLEGLEPSDPEVRALLHEVVELARNAANRLDQRVHANVP